MIFFIYEILKESHEYNWNPCLLFKKMAPVYKTTILFIISRTVSVPLLYQVKQGKNSMLCLIFNEKDAYLVEMLIDAEEMRY